MARPQLDGEFDTAANADGEFIIKCYLDSEFSAYLIISGAIHFLDGEVDVFVSSITGALGRIMYDFTVDINAVYLTTL